MLMLDSIISFKNDYTLLLRAKAY